MGMKKTRARFFFVPKSGSNLFLLRSAVWNSLPGLLGAIETEIISRASIAEPSRAPLSRNFPI